MKRKKPIGRKAPGGGGDDVQLWANDPRAEGLFLDLIRDYPIRGDYAADRIAYLLAMDIAKAVSSRLIVSPILTEMVGARIKVNRSLESRVGEPVFVVSTGRPKKLPAKEWAKPGLLFFYDGKSPLMRMLGEYGAYTFQTMPYTPTESEGSLLGVTARLSEWSMVGAARLAQADKIRDRMERDFGVQGARNRPLGLDRSAKPTVEDAVGIVALSAEIGAERDMMDALNIPRIPAWRGSILAASRSAQKTVESDAVVMDALGNPKFKEWRKGRGIAVPYYVAPKATVEVEDGLQWFAVEAGLGV